MSAIGLAFASWPRHLVVSEAATANTLQWSLLRLGSQLVGSRMLAAASADELHDLLDELLDQEDVSRLFQLHGTTEKPPEAEIEQGLLEAIDQALALASEEQHQQLADLYPAWADVCSQLAKQNSEISAEPLESKQGTLAAHLLDTAIHPTIRRLQHSCICGNLASLAILQAAITRKTLPAWQASELLSLVTQGVRASLRLMASVPNVQISEATVPKNERLDLERLQQENRAAERGASLLTLLESARRQAIPRPSSDD